MAFRVDGVSASYSQRRRNGYCDRRLEKITVAVSVLWEILLNLFGISYKYYYKPSPLSSTAYTSVLPCVILTAATSFFYLISARRHHHYHNLSTSTCRSACLQRLRHSRLRLLACIQSTRSPSVNLDTD